MSRVRMLGILAGAALAAWGGSLRAAPEPARSKRAVDEHVEVVRRVIAIGVDPRNVAEAGECDAITPSDVRVTIDGLNAEVLDVERLPPARVHWIVLDMSQSADLYRDSAKRAAELWVREVVEPSGAEAAVVIVDEDTRLLVAPTTDYDRVADAIRGAPPGGQSFLVDGLVEILRQVQGDAREHLVLYWTDGDDAMSLTGLAELDEALKRARAARIVPLAYPQFARESHSRPMSPLFFKLAHDSGGRVLSSADRLWPVRLQDDLRRRWFVTLAAPGGASIDGAASVSVESKRCEARVLPWDPTPSVSRSGVTWTPTSWIKAWRKQRKRLDEDSCVLDDPAARAWDARPSATSDRIQGCVLDVAQESGLLYRGRAGGKTEILSPPLFAARAWRLDIVALDRLPDSPAEVLDRLAGSGISRASTGEDDSPPEASPQVVHGRAFLTLQPAIARALWDGRPDYRAFASRRLAERAAGEIAGLRRRLHVDMPELDGPSLDSAAESSLDGRWARAAAEAPSDADLRTVLASWLGDVPAAEAFTSWEKSLVTRRAAGEASAEIEDAWARARSWFALPKRGRVLVPLVLARDRARDVVGFWRIMPPRPFWILERAVGDDRKVPYDHVPERPLAVVLLDRAAEQAPGLLPRLAAGGYRPESIVYTPLVKAWREDPAHPFGHGVVRVVWRAGADAAGPQVTLEGAFDGVKDAPVEIVSIRAAASGDATMDEALAPFPPLNPPATARSKSRPRRGRGCGRRRASSRATAA